MPTPPPFDAAWDAGDLGCGELLLALRTRFRELAAGAVFKLSTTDAGAPEDLPAWCRMTGHRLVLAAHPDYYVRKGP
jgi:tRNA 2-thiouridine synthesizing protein A